EFLRLARQWQRLYREFDNVKNVSEISEISIAAQDRINIFTLKELYNHILDKYPEIRLDTHTRHSAEIYTMMESHVLDVGFASALLPTKNITATPLFEEPLLIISYKTPFLKKVVDPEDLDPDLEIFSRWSDEFEIWHDQIWPGKRYRMHIGTTAMAPNHLYKPGRWAIMPVSALNSLMQNDDFTLHTLSVQTPVRFIYYLEQKEPRPSRISAINIFKKEMLEFLKKDPYISLNPNL
ncbi:MAG: hypothetical protein IKO38_07665, partial [Erysipelotrichaceae bacterium]|nr:hypothetical protein [Erysipelotrichaceae bacterium]